MWGIPSSLNPISPFHTSGRGNCLFATQFSIFFHSLLEPCSSALGVRCSHLSNSVSRGKSFSVVSPNEFSISNALFPFPLLRPLPRSSWFALGGGWLLRIFVYLTSKHSYLIYLAYCCFGSHFVFYPAFVATSRPFRPLYLSICNGVIYSFSVSLLLLKRYVDKTFPLISKLTVLLPPLPNAHVDSTVLQIQSDFASLFL